MSREEQFFFWLKKTTAYVCAYIDNKVQSGARTCVINSCLGTGTILHDVMKHVSTVQHSSVILNTQPAEPTM